MKKRYKRTAYLVDDGILLSGYKDKRGFHPNDKGCGFSYQKITKKMIGKELFFNLNAAQKKVGKLEVV